MTGWTSKAALLAAIAMAAIVIGCGGGSDIEPADVVLRSGKIITMDSKGTIAQAVAVRGGRIAFVGSDADAAQPGSARLPRWSTWPAAC